MNYIQEKKQEGFTPTPISIGMSSHSERGFTLVETLVAITVLLIAIVAPLSIVANSINATYAARDQMTAVYLASEAIEIIRQKRDTNVMQGGTASWDDGFGTGECDLGSTNACSVSILDMLFITVPYPAKYELTEYTAAAKAKRPNATISLLSHEVLNPRNDLKE